MKIPLAIASAVLLGGVLTACGGSDSGGGSAGGTGGSGGDYCKDIKAAKTTIGGLGAGDAASIGDAFTTFHKLADEAPGAIKDDWKTLDSAVTTIESAFEDAGIKIEDFQSGKIPPNFDASKLAALAPKLQKLNDAEFKKASKAIETHAKSVCKINLNTTE